MEFCIVIMFLCYWKPDLGPKHNYGRTKSLILILSLGEFVKKNQKIRVRWLPHPGQICLQTFGWYFLVQMSISKYMPWPPYIIVFYCFVKLEIFKIGKNINLKFCFLQVKCGEIINTKICINWWKELTFWERKIY